MSGGDVASVAAMEDARVLGVGFVRIQRITTEQYRVARLHPGSVTLVDERSFLDRHLLDVVLASPCSYCMAGVGVRCRTASGGRSSTFHVDRSTPVHDAWRSGFAGGLVDAVRRITGDWTTPADDLLTEHGLVSR